MIDDNTIRDYMPFCLRIWHDKNCSCGLPKPQTDKKCSRSGNRIHDRQLCRISPCIYDRWPTLEDLYRLDLNDVLKLKENITYNRE